MPVTRRYACDQCDHEWTYLHLSRDEPYPECPECAAQAAASLPTLFAITTVKAKAVDHAFRIAQEDYGMTDMNDASREGDIAAKAPPPIQTAEAEALTMAMKEMVPDLTHDQAEGVKHFWQPGSSFTPSQTTALAAPGAAEARALGADPLAMVHQSAAAAEKADNRRGPKMRVEGRAKASDVM